MSIITNTYSGNSKSWIKFSKNKSNFQKIKKKIKFSKKMINCATQFRNIDCTIKRSRVQVLDTIWYNLIFSVFFVLCSNSEISLFTFPAAPWYTELCNVVHVHRCTCSPPNFSHINLSIYCTYLLFSAYYFIICVFVLTTFNIKCNISTIFLCNQLLLFIIYCFFFLDAVFNLCLNLS